MERKNYKKYFEKFPKQALWILLAGIPMLFLQGLGLIPIAIGTVWIVLWYKRPTDDIYDEMLAEDLKNIKEVAINKLRLNEELMVRDAILIPSLRLWDIAGAEIGIRKGKDDYYRYMPLEVTVIAFTEHKLVIYQAVLDLTTGKPLNVNTSKFFYQDVVTFETKTLTITIPKEKISKKIKNNFPGYDQNIEDDKLQINAVEQFILTTKAGQSVKITLPNASIIESIGEEEVNISSKLADKAISSIEKMLDDKKGGYLNT